jgi:hypothetical protein
MPFKNALQVSNRTSRRPQTSNVQMPRAHHHS